MDREKFFTQWSELHGGASVTGIVRLWLTVSYFIIKPLLLLRITPNVVTTIGLALGALTWKFSGNHFAIALLLLSLIADGIDGSLAIASSRVSLWGAAYDSVVDRVVEFFWALTFIKIGAPSIIVGLAWAAALTQEYMRARAGGLGHRKVGVVTISERPVRAIFLAVALISQMAGMHYLGLIASLWLMVQSFSLVVILRDSYSALRGDN